MEKIWLKNYEEGVPTEINADTYSSLTELLEKACQRYQHQKAFYSLGVNLTFKQIDEYSRAFGAYLQKNLGLNKGDRVAIMLPNILQYPIVMLGALRAGLIIVNVNPLYTVPELIHQMNDSGAQTIVVLANFAATVEKAIPHTHLKNIIVTNTGDMLSLPKALLIHFVLKYIKKKIPAWNIPTALSFKKVLHEGTALTCDEPPLNGEDIAFLQYTGGTTGVSKGAILTHRNIIANILQAEAWFRPLFSQGQEIVITALPLYHIFSLTANCLFFMEIGGLNVLIPNARDTEAMIKEMSKFKFTVITGVNTLFNLLLKNPKFKELDFSKLKVALGGGMAVQRSVAEKWQEVTGKPISEAYGLTETSPCVSMNPSKIEKYNGTVGLPVSSTLLTVFDEEGNEVPVGKSGELAIKGPQVMRGYWQNDYETNKVFTNDGWLLTGDIASINKEGFLKIIERKKDMILVSGFNVYPNEIEDVLVSMPGIREAAVIGVPDENSGEVPKAFVVLDDPRITVDDIKNYCHARLTKYKVPKKFKICNELPKSNVGKVLRRALKDEHPSQV